MYMHLFNSYLFDTHCVRGMLHNGSNHKVGDSSCGVRMGGSWNRLSFPLPSFVVKAVAPHYWQCHVGLSVCTLSKEPV